MEKFSWFKSKKSPERKRLVGKINEHIDIITEQQKRSDKETDSEKKDHLAYTEDDKLEIEKEAAQIKTNPTSFMSQSEKMVENDDFLTGALFLQETELDEAKQNKIEELEKEYQYLKNKIGGTREVIAEDSSLRYRDAYNLKFTNEIKKSAKDSVNKPKLPPIEKQKIDVYEDNANILSRMTEIRKELETLKFIDSNRDN